MQNIAIGNRINGSYELTFKLRKFEATNCQCSALTLIKQTDLMTWYKRLGHLGYQNMIKLSNNMVRGFVCKNVTTNREPICEVCVKSKMTQLPFNKKSELKSR